MAHQIEQMAYVSDTPWHGLGQQLSRQQPLEVWRRLDANRNLTGMPLAVEIEMSDNRLWGIRYDFNKLLQAQADHKLMVFQVQTSEEVEATFARLEESIQVYPHAAPCRYLLCGWSTQQNAFHFRSCEAHGV